MTTAPTPPLTHRPYLLILLALLLLGAAMRFYQLDSIPPGLTHDEAAIGFFARQIAENTGVEIDAPYGYANEPFTKYSLIPWFWLFGPTDWTLRAHQAFWGLLAIVTIYVWVSLTFDPRTGLLAAALQTVAYWPLTTSRMALNSNPTPALVTGAAIFLWLALDLHRPADAPAPSRPTWRAAGYWLGFILCLTFSIFTYEAARSTAAIFPVFLAYLFLTRARPLKSLIAFGGSGLLAAIWASVHLLNPNAWGRTGTLSVPITEARAGNFGPLLTNLREGLFTLFIQGDPFVVYNLPGRPNLDWLLGALLVGALIFCLYHWKQPRAAFILIWLFFGLLPTLVIGAFTAVLHSIAAQTLILALPAIGLFYLLEHRPPRWHTLASAALAGWIAIAGVLAARDYFTVWATSDEMRPAYFANFGDLTRWLDTTAPPGPVALSSAFPDYPHDPLTYALRVQRADLTPYWFDAREALVFPATDATLVLPVNAYAHPLFQPWLPLGTATRIPAADPIDPYFDVVPWQPAGSLAALLADPATLPVNDPNANLGGALELIAYRLEPTADGLTVMTIWRILDPAALGPRHITEYDVRANTFFHLLDDSGNIVAQRDTLAAPAAFWQPGQHIAQLHHLTPPPGTYTPRLGLYTFPLIDGASTNLRTPTGAEFIFLPPVTFNP